MLDHLQESGLVERHSHRPTVGAHLMADASWLGVVDRILKINRKSARLPWTR